MGKLSQANRTATLKTPLGDDVLVLKSFSGTEGLGELFEFQVDALSEDKNIDFDDVLGQACTVKLKTYKGAERFFCGVLTHSQWAGVEGQNFNYKLTLRPWFWLLAHRANCRIFLDKKVTKIIEDVFTDAGFSSGTDFKFRTSGNYDNIDYCVQYRETDFAFVSRLMEQYGIYYYFKHSDGQHTMILADSLSSHDPTENLNEVPFHYARTELARVEQQLNEWTSDRRFRSGKIEYNDYDYLKPPKNLRAPHEAQKRSKFEVYDYPGKYDDQEKGKQFAKIRLEAEHAIDHRRMANGDAPSLFPGGLVKVKEHPISDENQDYLVVRAAHGYGTQDYGVDSSQHPAARAGYSGVYEFLPKNQQFRSLPLTPRPRIYGIQTAKVVVKKGDDGEEISTDEHGRIWVKFHWDREPQKTCPIRVAQAWSSKEWGGQFIPRVGKEVVVEFLEGDPDRPLVTGCVYNGDHKYPYTLPDNKTQSGMKSDSSKGHDGYNEFMFEDKAGTEFIRMHAQKDHNVRINNDQTGEIGNDRSWKIEKGDDNLTIQMGNQNVELQMGNQNITLDMGDQTTLLTMGNQNVQTMVSITHSTMTINLNGDFDINITAPLINLNGFVNINGGLVVDGQVPVLV
jgi:type VI secretion system secreted protein VgrG